MDFDFYSALLNYSLNVAQRNIYHGGTEEVDVDNDVVGGGVADDVAFKSCQTAARDADTVAQMEGHVCKVDGGVCIVEHELELLHLVVGDGGDGMPPEVIGWQGFVGKVTVDEAELEGVYALLLCGSDEDNGRYDHTLYFPSLAIAPHTGFLLCGNV